MKSYEFFKNTASCGVIFKPLSPENEALNILISRRDQNFLIESYSSKQYINTINYKFIIQRIINNLNMPDAKIIKKRLYEMTQELFDSYIKKEGF